MVCGLESERLRPVGSRSMKKSRRRAKGVENGTEQKAKAAVGERPLKALSGEEEEKERKQKKEKRKMDEGYKMSMDVDVDAVRLTTAKHYFERGRLRWQDV